MIFTVDRNCLEIVDQIDYESEYAAINRADGMLEQASIEYQGR
jgi:hypothetical protein